VECNDPHGGNERVCEGDRARVGVSHGMVEVKLFFYTYPPVKMEQTECSETSAYKILTPGNYPEENI
jgi:hypothetical protein